jgi:hypothetical protein
MQEDGQEGQSAPVLLATSADRDLDLDRGAPRGAWPMERKNRPTMRASSMTRLPKAITSRAIRPSSFVTHDLDEAMDNPTPQGLQSRSRGETSGQRLE